MTTDRKTLSDFRDRIVVDPKILVGKPVVKGTRIPVSLILNLVGHGATFDEIVDDYPILAVEDFRAAILYAGARLEGEDMCLLTDRQGGARPAAQRPQQA